MRPLRAAGFTWFGFVVKGAPQGSSPDVEVAVRRAHFASLIVLAIAACTPDDGLSPLIGRWGGNGIEVVGTQSTFRVELACQAADIGKAAVIDDDDGHFTIVGTVTTASSSSMIGWPVIVEGSLSNGRLGVSVKVNGVTRSWQDLAAGNGDWSEGRSCIL